MWSGTRRRKGGPTDLIYIPRSPASWNSLITIEDRSTHLESTRGKILFAVQTDGIWPVEGFCWRRVVRITFDLLLIKLKIEARREGEFLKEEILLVLFAIFFLLLKNIIGFFLYFSQDSRNPGNWYWKIFVVCLITIFKVWAKKVQNNLSFYLNFFVILTLLKDGLHSRFDPGSRRI